MLSQRYLKVHYITNQHKFKVMSISEILTSDLMSN